VAIVAWGALAAGLSEAQPPAASPRGPAMFGSDLTRISQQLGLTEEQKKKMESLGAERDAALAGWDRANQKRIAAIQAAIGKVTGKSSARKRAVLERQLGTLQSGRVRLAATHERRLFGVLTREQRGKWNGPILAGSVLKDLERLGLDETQKQKVHALCRARGEGISAPVDPKRHDLTFKAVKQQTITTVLTPAQRKQLQGGTRKAGSSSAKGHRGSASRGRRGA
jgi:Spy/CpxP family protein refolding chaperone